MADHYSKVKMFIREEGMNRSDDYVSLTYKESGDMSEWANRWYMKSISVTLLRLVPKSFHNLIMYVLNSITNKLIELPRQFIKSAIENPGSELWNKMSDMIKKEMLGIADENEYIKKHGTRVSCLANMMQGILHYTSSLAHTSSILLFLETMTKMIESKGAKVVHSFECSSDDKGILMTIITKKDRTIPIQKIQTLWSQYQEN